MFGNLSFVLFFCRLGQWYGRIDGKVSIVRVFFPEGVLGVHREFFTSLQDIRKFFVDEFEMLTREL